MTKNHYEKVKEFHDAFDPTLNTEPNTLDEETAVARISWVAEELLETLQSISVSENHFKRLAKRLSLLMESEVEKIVNEDQFDQNLTELDRLIGMVDGLVDALYFIYGTFEKMNINPTPLFDIVHNANMGKLFPDGKPRYREGDGKILKPENWEESFAPEPKIKQEILRQIEESYGDKDE